MKPTLELASHALCPALHMWVMGLTLANKVRDVDFSVTRLEYPSMSAWGSAFPAQASTPFLQTKTGLTLWGSLPVMHYFEETIANSALLASSAEERVRVRNRAMGAMDLLMALRPILVSKTSEELTTGLVRFFVAMKGAELLLWSEAMHLDRVALAAFATVAGSQTKLMDDARWKDTPKLHALIRTLAAHPLVRETRADRYDATFDEFFTAFGSTYGSPSTL